MAVGSERGTTHLDSLYVDQLLVGGTIVGSVLNLGTETITREVITDEYVSGTVTGSEGVFTNLSVKGTTTGSFLKGTFTGDFLGSTIKANDMLYYTSGAIQVTTSAATCTHGLGGIPSIILCTPNVVSATGVVKIDGANIGSAWFTMTANETGTATAYAIR
jgi:hypothetical protein